ncbi:MAG: hypothetical protein JOZ75_02260 [Candidatus Dormibacteraeota bacterium]|nr:hypothetical protein [Candidatus Dormibacteraeota bacterium]
MRRHAFWLINGIAAVTAAAPAPAPPSATPCVIPQGGGGDGDADNFGAPSDNDGCDR